MSRFVFACATTLAFAGVAPAEVWVVGPTPRQSDTDFFRRGCPTPKPAQPDKDDIAPPVYVPPVLPAVEPEKVDDTLVKVLAACASAVAGAAAGVAVQWKKTHPSV